MPTASAETAELFLPKRRSLYGSSVKVMCDRGELVESELAPYATVTIHPSALLRIGDPEEKRLARAEFERDLGAAWEHLGAAVR